MTRTFTHEAQLLAWPPGAPVAEVLTADLTEDTGWMPRWSAVVTCITPPGLIDNEPQYLTVRMSRIASHGFRLRDWTARWGGSVSAITSEFYAGIWPALITDALAGDSDALAPAAIQVTMLARDYTHKIGSWYERGVTTINLTSCEMLLGDLKYLLEPAYMNNPDPMNRERADAGWVNGTAASALVGELIGYTNAVISERPTTDKTLREIVSLPVGAAILDPIHEALTDLDMLLWAERPDRYILRNRVTSSPLKYTLTPDTGIIDAEYVTDIGAANKTGSMRLVESPSNAHVDVYYYGNAPGVIVGDFTELKRSKAFESRPPGTYPHASTTKPRTGSRSRVLRVQHVSHYGFRADDRVRVQAPGIDRTGYVKAVTYHYPGGLADLDIEHTQPYA